MAFGAGDVIRGQQVFGQQGLDFADQPRIAGGRDFRKMVFENPDGGLQVAVLSEHARQLATGKVRGKGFIELCALGDQ